jgi:hypothetical protein
MHDWTAKLGSKPEKTTAAACLFLLFFLLFSAPLFGQQSGDIQSLIKFQNVFRDACSAPPCPSDGRITTAQVSTFLPNEGQSHHLVMVLFPTTAVSVSPIQVRLEASFDGSSWFPVQADITSVPSRGGVVYTLAQANGVFPALRVRSVVNTPGALPMVVYYAGSPFPVGNLNCIGDRCTFTGSSGYDKATFVICNGSPCAVGSNLTNEYIIVSPVAFRVCYACAKTAPTGADLLIDINLNGTSIFGSPKLTVAAGSTCSTAISQAANFAVTSAAALQRLTVDIDQIGSVAAGQDVTVTCVLDFQ